MIQRLFLGICILIYRTFKYIAKGLLFIISIPFQFLFLLINPKGSNTNKQIPNQKQLKIEAKHKKKGKMNENITGSVKTEPALLSLKEEQKKAKLEHQAMLKEEAKQKKLKALEEKKAKKEEARQKKLKEIEEKKAKKEEARQKRIQARKERKAKQLELKKQKKKLTPEQEEKKRQKQIALEEKRAKKEEARQKRIQAIEAKKAKQAEKLELKKQQKIEKIRNRNRSEEEKIKRKAMSAEERKKEKQRKIEEKKQAKERKKQEKLDHKKALKEAREKNQEAYINEDIEKEKPNTFAVLSDKLKEFNKIPKKIAGVFLNNSFIKNARNRRDINRQALLIDFEGDEAKKSDVKLVYEYEAKNKEGKFVKGYFEAYSRVEVHSFLLSEGYEVYSIKTNKWITLLHGGSDVNKVKFKSKDLIFFLAQLSTYLKAGITLVESLRILSRQFVKQKKYEKIFRSIIYELTMGENFSTALEKQNVAFPKLLINMVKTAEMTGELPEVLDDMVDYYTEIEETRRQFVTAMTYPTIVGIFALGVITFILMFVVPRFVDIYNTMDGTEIPSFTKLVMSVSFFLQNNIITMVIVIVLIIAIWLLLYKKNRFFRTLNQWVVMHIPAIGDTMIYSEVATFTKTFSSLLAHNVPIPECLEILNKITSNEIYKMMILDVVSNLAKGGKISDAFEGNWAFPIPAYEMICTGEATGELPDMLSKVSAYYQSLEKTNVTRIKTFIEPILTIFLTVIVGVIILAVIIPMFNLYQSVQNMQ